MVSMAVKTLFLDPSRCIGCRACEAACRECDSHKGESMVMISKIPADGVVQTADASRCIACRNCVYACPFGVPKMDVEARLMKKCNLCYDRTSQGLKPWCAQACPTQALWYGDYEEFVNQRRGHPVNHTVFG